jgi:hypothetical protein
MALEPLDFCLTLPGDLPPCATGLGSVIVLYLDLKFLGQGFLLLDMRLLYFAHMVSLAITVWG